jgi:prophage regulatory protein
MAARHSTTAPAPQQTRLLSVKQVAARLSVTPRTVWRWVAKGALPRPLRLSEGCVRWFDRDVDEFLAGLTREGGAA